MSLLDPGWGAVLRPFRPHRKFLFWNCVICTALGVLLAVVLPKRYTAKATILPPSEEQTGLSMSSLLRGLAVPGVRVPLTVTPSDMVQSVLDSDRLRGMVALRHDPRRIYGIRDSLDALEKLAKSSKFRVTPLGVVEIKVVAPRAQDAADLANAYVDELDRFTRTQRMSRGHRTRLFVERRLEEVRTSLDSLERGLAAFQQRHHVTALGPAVTSSVESGARMFADRMNLEFQLQLARSYATENSQEVRLLQARLDALDRELDRLPPLGMEMASLMRDVKAHEQAYAFLTAQVEDARIEEARDVVAVELLDAARPPRKASWPRKSYFAAGAFALSLIGGMVWVSAGASRIHHGPRQPSLTRQRLVG